MTEVTKAVEQLAAVQLALFELGFSVTQIESQPEWCIQKFAARQRKTDWRDAFMAALAGGETSNGAASIADAAVEILAARRLKVGGAP